MSYWNEEALAIIETNTKRKLSELGKDIHQEMTRIVPVDTGRLRDSLYYKVIDQNTLRVGAETEYAIYVECGTRKQHAQPYCIPSVEKIIKNS